MKGFVKGLFVEGRLWVILGLLVVCIACAVYIRDHAKHPAHHVSNFITK